MTKVNFGDPMHAQDPYENEYFQTRRENNERGERAEKLGSPAAVLLAFNEISTYDSRKSAGIEVSDLLVQLILRLKEFKESEVMKNLFHNPDMAEIFDDPFGGEQAGVTLLIDMLRSKLWFSNDARLALQNLNFTQVERELENKIGGENMWEIQKVLKVMQDVIEKSKQQK